MTTTSFTVCAKCDRAVSLESLAYHSCDFPTISHQPREHSVRCVRHNNPTFRWDAACDRCVIERYIETQS